MDHNSSGSSDLSSNNSGDAEGVWSADIDQAFHEALEIYPPCGRRKIILSEEGKMYGRNELIARYIKLRCGKTRTRKQVSSHIQVLARKKQRESVQGKGKAEEASNGTSGGSIQNPHMSHSSSTSPMHHLSPFNASLASPSTKIPVAFNSIEIDKSTSSNIDHILGNIKVDPDSYHRITSEVAGLSTTHTQNPTLDWQQHLPASFFNGHVGPVASITNEGAALNTMARLMSCPLSGLQINEPKSELIENQPRNIHFVMSHKIILCGLVAYIEFNAPSLMQTFDNSDHLQRFEIVRIPASFDEPFETINLGDIASKYPNELKELFIKGPQTAFYLFKCWANISFEISDEQKKNSLYAVDSYYKCVQDCEISVATKIYTFGRPLLQKDELFSPNSQDNQDGRVFYNYTLEKAPMCEAVVEIITQLKQKVNPEAMNSVLDNFTMMQIVSDKDTDETLMVMCFVFEISPEDEASTRVYRLTC